MLKSGSAAVGSTITVMRGGGVIQLSPGRVLLRGSVQESMPRWRSPYLLLLQYAPEADAFILATGFELNANGVYELDLLNKINNRTYVGTYPGSAAALVQAIQAHASGQGQ